MTGGRCRAGANETISLASAERRWSSRSKRTGEITLLGGGKACSIWAGVSLLVAPLFIPHRSLGGRKLEGARRGTKGRAVILRD